MNTTSREQLLDFFGAYFHEDWVLDDKTADDVLRRYIKVALSSNLASIADAIDSFVESVTDDVALDRALFRDLGCYYSPSADGQPTRAWLRHVSDTLRTASRAQGAK